MLSGWIPVSSRRFMTRAMMWRTILRLRPVTGRMRIWWGSFRRRTRGICMCFWILCRDTLRWTINGSGSPWRRRKTPIRTVMYGRTVPGRRRTGWTPLRGFRSAWARAGSISSPISLPWTMDITSLIPRKNGSRQWMHRGLLLRERRWRKWCASGCRPAVTASAWIWQDPLWRMTRTARGRSDSGRISGPFWIRNFLLRWWFPSGASRTSPWQAVFTWISCCISGLPITTTCSAVRNPGFPEEGREKSARSGRNTRRAMRNRAADWSAFLPAITIWTDWQDDLTKRRWNWLLRSFWLCPAPLSSITVMKSGCGMWKTCTRWRAVMSGRDPAPPCSGTLP